MHTTCECRLACTAGYCRAVRKECHLRLASGMWRSFSPVCSQRCSSLDTSPPAVERSLSWCVFSLLPRVITNRPTSAGSCARPCVNCTGCKTGQKRAVHSLYILFDTQRVSSGAVGHVKKACSSVTDFKMLPASVLRCGAVLMDI